MSRQKKPFIRTCELCRKNRAVHKHHLFSQTKVARKKYGSLIDHPNNIIHLCFDCHMNKPIPKLTEEEFEVAVSSPWNKSRFIGEFRIRHYIAENEGKINPFE